MIRRKQPFILLEIFIAISILALVIIPLSSFPYKAYQKQTESMKQVECERIYHLAYADFLSSIETNYDKDELDLGSFEANLSSIGKTQYNAFANIERKVADEKHLLLETTISLIPENKNGYTPKKQIYVLYVEKK